MSTIIHQAYFWLNNPTSANKDTLIKGIKQLAEIPHVQDLRVGIPAQTEARDVVDHSYHVFEQMCFASEEAQRDYQNHPIHLKFVHDHQHLWAKVVVYDNELIEK